MMASTARWGLLLVTVFLLWGCSSHATTGPSSETLRSRIAQIKAIDNHSHGDPAGSTAGDDRGSDNPLGDPDPLPLLRVFPRHPDYIQAWRALYGYKHTDMEPGHVLEALAAKRSTILEKGEAYPAWVLDRAGIETVLINADSLGPGQSAPRFLWVPHATDLLFPLNEKNTDLEKLMTQVRVGTQPATLETYTANVVTPLLEDWKRSGAVAIKIAAAYRRPLAFAPDTEHLARRAYARNITSRHPDSGEYKALQDYLFFYVAREAGRVGLVVHIHTGVGNNDYFDIAGSNPMLLESAMSHPSLRKTTFVLIHGGWPFDKEAGPLLMHPNVYADCSAQPVPPLDARDQRDVTRMARVHTAQDPAGDGCLLGAERAAGGVGREGLGHDDRGPRSPDDGIDRDGG